MGARPGTRNLVSYVLSILLLVAIAAGAVLVALQLRGDAPIHIEVGPAEGTECPTDVGAPACFRFTVTNVGNRPTAVRCETSAEGGQRATFLTDSPVYESAGTFEPGVTEELWVEVDAGETDVVTEPTLVCDAV